MVQGIALLTLPIAFVIFRPLPDRGYLFAKALGLLLVGLVVWLLASLQWMAFSRGSIAIALTLYTRAALAMGLSVEQVRTGATIILAIVAIWVLTVLSRPVTRVKVLVIGAMFIALTAIFTVPILGQFFQLQDPGEDGAWLITGVVIIAVGAIEVVRFAHRRFVRRTLESAASVPAPTPAAARG